jgi:hypothetical protein
MRALIENGDTLQVRLVTSADDIHAALTSPVKEMYSHGHTFPIDKLPAILNLAQYPTKF